MAEAHPKNAPGPFYVAEGECVGCGVPTEIAPDIFGSDDRGPTSVARCFVRAQPCTAEALAEIVRAMTTAEVDCIRYRGCDPKTIAELDRQGLLHLCDVVPE